MPTNKKTAKFKLNTKCTCLGEGDKFFVIRDFSPHGTLAFLYDMNGYPHGWEGLHKLTVVKS